MSLTDRELDGKVAYDNFMFASLGANWKDVVLEWEDLPETMAEAWCRAAEAVRLRTEING